MFTLKSSYHNYAVSPNLLKRDFKADKPNQKWVGDITYIPTDEGWLYAAIVKDLCLKKIVGYAFSSHIDTNLIVSALEMAVNRQKPQENLIFHSDRGVQYASGGYREAWNKCGRLSKTKERLRFIPFFVAFLCPFLLGWHN